MAAGGHGGPVCAERGVGGSPSSPRGPASSNAPAASGGSGRGGGAACRGLRDGHLEAVATSDPGAGGSSSSPRGPAPSHAVRTFVETSNTEIHQKIWAEPIDYVVGRKQIELHRTLMRIPSTHLESVTQMVKSVLGKIKSPKSPKLHSSIKSPKMPGEQQAPGNLTLFSVGAVTSALHDMGAGLLKYFRGIKEFLRSFVGRNLGLVFLLLCGFAYRGYLCWNHRHGHNPIQELAGRKILLLADDNFGYDNARRTLKISATNEFEIVIPLCVTEWLEKKMVEDEALSHMATASLLMVEDLSSLGHIRLQTTEEENEVRSYEEE